jgi:hypothetical protein
MRELRRKTAAIKWICMLLSTLEKVELAPLVVVNGQYPFMSVTNASMSMTFADTPDLYGRVQTATFTLASFQLSIHSTTLSQYYSITSATLSQLLLYCSATLLQCYAITVLRYHSATLSQCYSITVLLYHSATLLQCYAITVLLYHSATLSQCYSITVLLYHSAIREYEHLLYS